MKPEALFHELLRLGLNWAGAKIRLEAASNVAFLGDRERPSLLESNRGLQDDGRMFCHDHTEGLNWRHLNRFQHRGEIRCRLLRGKANVGVFFGCTSSWKD
jgi:hypothetical protein